MTVVTGPRHQPESIGSCNKPLRVYEPFGSLKNDLILAVKRTQLRENHAG